MNNLIRASFLFFFVLLISPNSSFSQVLSDASKKLKFAYDELKEQPDSKEKQLAYLGDFPQNKQQFMEVFQTNDFSQLYQDSHEYISAFIELYKYYPAEIINRSINIGKDLSYEADAIGEMQHSIVELGNKNILLFSSKLKSLPASQKNHLITFLADVENHKAYHEYQQLIDSLKKIGDIKLADKFIKARALREQLKDH